MSMNAVSSKCPFLARVPSSFLGHAGPSLNMYGQRCPVMARMFHRTAAGGTKTAQTAPMTKTLTLGEFCFITSRNKDLWKFLKLWLCGSPAD